MNVEIGTEAALFPEKEYINGIFVAVQLLTEIYLSRTWTTLSIPGLRTLQFRPNL